MKIFYWLLQKIAFETLTLTLWHKAELTDKEGVIGKYVPNTTINLKRLSIVDCQKFEISPRFSLEMPPRMNLVWNIFVPQLQTTNEFFLQMLKYEDQNSWMNLNIHNNL